MSASPLVCLLLLLFVGRHLSAIKQGNTRCYQNRKYYYSINRTRSNMTSLIFDVRIVGKCPQFCTGRILDK